MPELKLTLEENWVKMWAELHHSELGDCIDQRPILKAFGRIVRNETLEAAAKTAHFFPTICERCSGNGEVGHGEGGLITCPKCEGCGHKFHHEIPDLIAANIRSLIQKEGEPDARENQS